MPRLCKVWRKRCSLISELCYLLSWWFLHSIYRNVIIIASEIFDMLNSLSFTGNEICSIALSARKQATKIDWLDKSLSSTGNVIYSFSNWQGLSGLPSLSCQIEMTNWNSLQCINRSVGKLEICIMLGCWEVSESFTKSPPCFFSNEEWWSLPILFDLWNRFSGNMSHSVRDCLKIHFVRRYFPPRYCPPIVFCGSWSPECDAWSRIVPYVASICAEVRKSVVLFHNLVQDMIVYPHICRIYHSINFWNLYHQKDASFRAKKCSGSIARQVTSNTRGQYPELFMSMSSDSLALTISRIASKIESGIFMIHKSSKIDAA